MKLLALETSTDACSIALECDGEVLLDHRMAPQEHAQILLPMIDAMFANAGIKASDLDGVAFGCGPGSFTGVRIAAATTQGIAFGVDVGVIPVSSLQALAQGAFREHNASHVLATFDARMSEVYWGAYALGDDGIVCALQVDCVCPPDKVVMPVDESAAEWCLLGSGADQYADILTAAVGEHVQLRKVADCWPNAQDVLRVALPVASAGGFLSAAEASPVYLRDRVALTEKQRADGERL